MISRTLLAIILLATLGCVRPGYYNSYRPYGLYRPYGYHSARSAIRKDYEKSIKILRRSPYRPYGQRPLRRL
jgi:hypothetical protein